jgi:hypothetical protein
MKTKIVSCHTAHSKPVKQEVNGTVKLPPLVFPGESLKVILSRVFNFKLGCFALEKAKVQS